MKQQRNIRCPLVQIQRINQKRDEWHVARGMVKEGPPMLTNREITIVGVVPNLAAGQWYAFDLEKQTHARFGDQYHIKAWEKAIPRDRNSLALYLQDILKGVGQKRAESIVDQFGDDVVNVLDSKDATELLRPLLGDDLAENVAEQWAQERADHHIGIVLRQAGLGPKTAQAVREMFGDDTAKVLAETPYKLLEVPRIGFKTADEVALNLGVAPDSPDRIRAALAHTAKQQGQNGHCYTPIDQLVMLAEELIHQPTHKIVNVLMDNHNGEAIEDSLIVDEGNRGWYRAIYNAEVTLAAGIKRLTESVSGIARLIENANPDDVAVATGLTEEQANALHLVKDNKIVVITGGPGTGKTRTVLSIIQMLEGAGVRNIACCAPTGIAALRMTTVTGHKASTIHSLVGNLNRENESTSIPDVFIIDESSMINLTVMEWLIAAIPNGAHVVFVGDADQLPPIGEGEPFADMIRAGVPQVRLTKIMRQGEHSMIIKWAHALMKGNTIPISNRLDGDDVFFFEIPDEERALEELVRIITKSIPEKMGITPEEVRVIAPVYKGTLGIENINAVLQQELNPPDFSKTERRWFDRVLREGDRLVWTGPNDREKGIVKGEELYVLRIDTVYDDKLGETVESVHLKATDHEVTVPIKELSADHGYCLSVHKSQGSEYACAIVIAHKKCGFNMLTRDPRLLYTAGTRSRQLLILLGEKWVYEKAALAALNHPDWKRRTLLMERITGEEVKKAEGFPDWFFTLPEKEESGGEEELLVSAPSDDLWPDDE